MWIHFDFSPCVCVKLLLNGSAVSFIKGVNKGPVLSNPQGAREYAHMCPRAGVRTRRCVMGGFWSTLTGEWLSTFISLQRQQDIHTHTERKTEWRFQREGSCCSLEDAASACMLKLALNVWITHGSSHTGFSNRSLESRDVSDYMHTNKEDVSSNGSQTQVTLDNKT